MHLNLSRQALEARLSAPLKGALSDVARLLKLQPGARAEELADEPAPAVEASAASPPAPGVETPAAPATAQGGDEAPRLEPSAPSFRTKREGQPSRIGGESSPPLPPIPVTPARAAAAEESLSTGSARRFPVAPGSADARVSAEKTLPHAMPSEAQHSPSAASVPASASIPESVTAPARARVAVLARRVSLERQSGSVQADSSVGTGADSSPAVTEVAAEVARSLPSVASVEAGAMRATPEPPSPTVTDASRAEPLSALNSERPRSRTGATVSVEPAWQAATAHASSPPGEARAEARSQLLMPEGISHATPGGASPTPTLLHPVESATSAPAPADSHTPRTAVEGPVGPVALVPSAASPGAPRVSEAGRETAPSSPAQASHRWERFPDALSASPAEGQAAPAHASRARESAAGGHRFGESVPGLSTERPAMSAWPAADTSPKAELAPEFLLESGRASRSEPTAGNLPESRGESTLDSALESTLESALVSLLRDALLAEGVTS